MGVMEHESSIHDYDSQTMVDALWERGDLGIAANEYRRRTAALRKHWWERFRLAGPYRAGWGIWGLSSR